MRNMSHYAIYVAVFGVEMSHQKFYATTKTVILLLLIAQTALLFLYYYKHRIVRRIAHTNINRRKLKQTNNLNNSI